MLNSPHIQIEGKVAEIIDDDSKRYITIVCAGNKLLVTIDTLEDISLGDTIVINGNLAIGTMSINGIEIEMNKN